MGQVKTLSTLIGVALIAVSHSASAATPTYAEKQLMARNIKISEAFPSASGLKAIIADNGKEKRLFYVTPDGKTLISGMLFDGAGRNITTSDLSRAGIPNVGEVKDKSAAQLDGLWTRAAHLNWIADGAPNAKRVMYVIFDPNCPYCHRLWSSLRGPVQAGSVQVRWLPVAILKDNSKNLAAAIYSAKDRNLAMSKMADWTLAPAFVTDSINKSVAYNLLLLRDTGFTGVPTILVNNGGKIRATMGTLSDQELAALLH